MNTHTLDVKGQLCPIPVIRTQNQVKKLAVGDRLEIVCTDPGVRQDIPAWCRIHGHTIIAINSNDKNEIRVTIEVGED